MMIDLTSYFVIACWAIVAVYWAISALFVKRSVERQGAGWRLLIPVIVFVGVSLNRDGLPVMDARLWSHTLVVGLAGDFIVLLGFAVVLWARIVLGGNWSGNVAIKEAHELIQHGPYAYARHPIYSGFLIMGLGSAVIYGLMGGFIFLAVTAFGFWLKVLQEERLLTSHFPTAYGPYKARVKALIPFLV
jgi:protein-S-isoprenylcysteine O-methyltransferase Ste14